MTMRTYAKDYLNNAVKKWETHDISKNGKIHQMRRKIPQTNVWTGEEIQQNVF